MRPAKKQRTKCFSGCWTCRSRRVKCDEQSPSCQRCVQFGVQCEGYDIRLHWVQCTPNEVDHGEEGQDGGTVKTSGVTRRSYAHLGVSTLPRVPSPELDAALRDIDVWAPGQSPALERGAFSVFSTDWSEQSYNSENASRTVQSPTINIPVATIESDHHFAVLANENTSVVAESTDGGGHQLSQVSQVLHEGCGSLPVTSGTIRVSEVHVYADNVPVAHTLLSLGRSSSYSAPATAKEADQASPRRQNQMTAPSRHLDALFMPSEQKRLIHQWVTFTSRKLVLLDEPHNPCRTMMLPMALGGLMSQSGDFNSDIVIFHAICASAAYNLYELGGRKDEEDHVLALKHDQQAIHYLRHNLTHAHEHRDQSFAMAIMACIAVEAVSGTTQRWRMHVSGGLAYLANLQSQGLPEVILSAFRQHVVKMAMLCGFPVPGEMKSFLDDDDHSAESLEFTFPYYGISRSFLRALDRINAFSVSGPAALETLASTTQKGIDAFELQLYLDFPSLAMPLQTNPPASSNPIHTTVVAHAARAFYYAALVYFQRRIRQTPLTDVQTLVRLGVGELESLERAGSEDELGCIMLWPALVLGAECGADKEQGRMRAWFQAQRRLGFRNVVVLEELVETVWKCRKRSTGIADWWKVVEEPRFDIFRL